MLEKLEAFVDINQLEHREGILSAGSRVVDTPTITIHNYSKWGWVVVYFQQFLQGVIDEATFFGLGDSSDLPIYSPDIDYLQVCFDTEIDQQGLLLVDHASISYYTMQTQQPFTVSHAELVII